MVASFVKGKHKADNVEVWVVPGSKQVEKQAIEEGIDKVFEAAGFMLRQPGCSACLGMNEDKIPAGKYCISTSNRNFEGRQGPNARTFLASPLTAALAAITGTVGDVRDYYRESSVFSRESISPQNLFTNDYRLKTFELDQKRMNKWARAST